MTAAIFGLLGVLVGGLITAGVEWWRDRRARAETIEVKREARTRAARMVFQELVNATAVMKVTVKNSRWSGHPLSTAAWQEYAPVLTTALGNRDWLIVSGAFGEIARLERLESAEVPGAFTAGRYVEIAVEELEEAVEVLRPLALPEPAPEI